MEKTFPSAIEVANLAAEFEQNPNNEDLFRRIADCFGIGREEILLVKLAPTPRTGKPLSPEDTYRAQRKVACKNRLRKHFSLIAVEKKFFQTGKPVPTQAHLVFEKVLTDGHIETRTKQGKCAIQDPLSWEEFVKYFKSKI
jgi:hypothetical protein